MIVLSLFDGISCGQIALGRVGIDIEKYFASEIKPSALRVTKSHYPNTIQLGDVTKLRYENGMLISEFGQYKIKIDLLIGGSPCQDFSPYKWINYESNGLEGDKSKLFFEYLRLLQEIKPKYFLLENVKMKDEAKEALNEFLGIEGIEINSSLVSYQYRPRIYWTNIPNVKPPVDKEISFQVYKNTDQEYCRQYKLKRTSYREKMWNNGKGKDESLTRLCCENVTYSDKVFAITRKQDRNPNSGLIECEDFCRYLTREELEKAQTLPAGYTRMLSYPQMQDVVGDCWTVDVIAHIFKNLGQEPLVLNQKLKKESQPNQLNIFDCLEE